MLPSICLLLSLSGLTTGTLSQSLVDLFSIDQNLTKGSLTFSRGKSVETIQFGGKSPHYAVGFSFPAELLPEPYRDRFKTSSVVQVFLGSSVPSGKIPHFGSMLLFLPSTARSADLKVPPHEERSSRKALFFQLRSPGTPTTAPEEDKLKGTYFASSGGAKYLSPKGSTAVAIAFSDRRFRFERNRIRVAVDAQMATPFNPEPAALKGTIDFAVFNPLGEDTRSVVKSLLAETLRSPLVPQVARSITKSR